MGLGLSAVECMPLLRQAPSAQRFEAGQWLTERGWGKPGVQVEVAGPAVVIVENGGDVE
jgi:hypothetical protein